MEKLPMCRICLVEDVRMYVVVNKNLHELYEKLTDVPFVTEDNRPMLACFFCCAKLKQCWRFQRKCLEAEELFTQMMNEDYEQDPLISQGKLSFYNGFMTTPVLHISIDDNYDKYQTECGDIIKEELPDFSKNLDDFIEPKEEGQTDESEFDNVDNSYPDVEATVARHAESDSDDAPLLEVKSEVNVEPESIGPLRAEKDHIQIETDRKGKGKKKEHKSLNKILGSIVTDPASASSSCKNKVRRHGSKLTGEFYKHQSNIIEVLRWSNATPIKLYNDLGYMCCHCEDQFFEPKELKKHTLQNHEDISKAHFLTNMSMAQYVVKLDITGLHCKICNKSIDTAEELMEHLKNEHKKVIYTDIKNHIVSYKFNTNLLECSICKNVYNKFRLLQTHMHMHYRNYICDICDAGFVYESALRAHRQMHKTGPFPCNTCSMVFDTLAKKNQHMRTEHIKPVRYTCGICKESFDDYLKKEAHLITIHGLQNQKAICKACGKEFKHRKFLAQHVRREHLMDNRHVCGVCKKDFFYPWDLKNHMSKHTGAKPFKCDICEKSFKLVKVLKEHMQIHSDYRRFKCPHCGLGFVRRSSMRNHMKNKHGEIFK